MSISIAQSRQQLSALIAAAQQQPQIITNRNKPVAVLVSAEYFARSEAAVKPVDDSFYAQVSSCVRPSRPKTTAALPCQRPLRVSRLGSAPMALLALFKAAP